MNKIPVILFLWFILITVSANGSNSSEWQICVTDPSGYTGITLASGRIGLVSSASPFKIKSVILNHVFDDYVYNKSQQLKTSRVLEGINFAGLDLIIDGDTVSSGNITNWQQVLDMKKARLVTSFIYKDKARISYSVYALRGMPYSGLTDVEVESLKQDINISVSGEIVCPSGYRQIVQTFKVLQDNDRFMPLLQTVAQSPAGKHTLAATAAFVFDNFSPEQKEEVNSPFKHSLTFHKKIEKNTTFRFAWEGAICTTGNFSDPQSESERMAIYILCDNKQSVIDGHIRKWDQLWQGDIEIEGDDESQKDIRLALYHLYAFSCPGSGLSISPMGLSSQGYNGHIFWDAEIWMFPPILVFHPDIAATMLDYRYNRLDKARQKASCYGFRGAMFPWESDDTGEEATPTFALTGAFEHHITADIGIAFWNYFQVTGDLRWLKEKGFPVIRDVAEFWVSRSVKNPDGTCSIRNVVGADEYAQNVDDDAFTNGAAKLVLTDAHRAAEMLEEKTDPAWTEIADHLKFYTFGNGITREYKGYDGQIIKQADENMLAYPLQLETDTTVILKNLVYYEGKMDKNGPAMGDAILSVLYARLGYPDKAYEMFRKAYIPNKRRPFGALAESANSDNPYFATGAGGMLQAVLFGFGGLEITEKGIIQQHSACLPKSWKKLIIRGVGPGKRTYAVTR